METENANTVHSVQDGDEDNRDPGKAGDGGIEFAVNFSLALAARRVEACLRLSAGGDVK